MDYCQSNLPNVRILVNNFQGLSAHEILQGLSTHNFALRYGQHQRLVSFKATGWMGLDYSELTSCLSSSPELDTLHLLSNRYSMDSMRPSFPDRKLRAEDRLPPIKELVLHNYSWAHSESSVMNFWNFSRLTHLELKEVCVNRFLRTVPTQFLQQLETLILEDLCDELINLATSRMYQLLLDIHALEKLSMKCLIGGILPAVLKHGAALRSLELRDYNGRTSKEPWCTFSIADVQSVGTACPNLAELTLDAWINDDKVSSSAFFMAETTIARMRNLRRLNIYSRTVQDLIPTRWNRASYSYMNKTVRIWLRKFLAVKLGAKMERVVIDVIVKGSAAMETDTQGSFGQAIWTYEDGKPMGEPAILEMYDPTGFGKFGR